MHVLTTLIFDLIPLLLEIRRQFLQMPLQFVNYTCIAIYCTVPVYRASLFMLAYLDNKPRPSTFDHVDIVTHVMILNLKVGT
ncbi:hypothetical protein ASPVEDRAFT_47493 [Aspergillus versicolor CBS 583.65]|uniref:Uncharacterized protein n=1 Tax=Aspergillus versicolor CBS 583.65 TaxID=1036611 RepID=A0A1L9Q3J7_ASPVE|nr:uncharacterized protein ASPVEDRAFT_47493 [Aspergillus versicolor CBS 583.65]OJJ08343.1 hypothetical protein ASPVEDRAFT_47493 [Aspergillus versicolor CBS 583.65]